MSRWVFTVIMILGFVAHSFAHADQVEFFGLDTIVPSLCEEKEENPSVEVRVTFLGDRETAKVVHSYVLAIEGTDFAGDLDDTKERILQDILQSKRPYKLSAKVQCNALVKQQIIPYLENVWFLWESEFSEVFTSFFDEEYTMPSMQGWDISSGGDPENISEEAKPFFDLSLSNEDKKNIRDLIFALADKNIFQLLAEKRIMDKKGDKIRKVHPLRFAGFVLTDPHMKKCMKTIERDALKWSHFIAGYEEKMKEEAKAGRLLRYLPGFVEYLSSDLQTIHAFIQNKDYAGMLRSFL